MKYRVGDYVWQSVKRDAASKIKDILVQIIKVSPDHYLPYCVHPLVGVNVYYYWINDDDYYQLRKATQSEVAWYLVTNGR